MDKTVIEYLVPIQSDKDVSEYNAMLREFCGKGNFTPCKTTDEHVEILINQLAEAIQKVGDDNGWYVGDGIKVKIELEYEPENK